MMSIIMNEIFRDMSVTVTEIGPLFLSMEIARLRYNKIDIYVSSF